MAPLRRFVNAPRDGRGYQVTGIRVRPLAGAKSDRHPVRSGQQAAAETGTKTPPSSEALGQRRGTTVIPSSSA